MFKSNVSSYTPVCHCNKMWSVGSKPIRWNVTTPTTLFLCILCHRKFVTINREPRSLNVWYNWCYATCVITSPIISTLSILNNWRLGGWQPCNHTILEIITWFKTMWPVTKCIDKTKMTHHRPGAVFPWFLFLFSTCSKDVATSFSIFLFVLSFIHNQQPVSMHARQIT